MLTLLTIVHFLVCIFLIIIVLLQHGKGADMGATFGGGSGKTVFGTEGPLPLLNKITTASAIIFMFTSVALAYYSANTTKSSVMKSLPISKAAEQGPAVTPVPVEIPMNDSKKAPAGDKSAAPAPAKFPGAQAPVEEPPKPPVADQAKQAETPAAPAPTTSAPAAAKPEQASTPAPQTKETAPTPTPGK